MNQYIIVYMLGMFKYMYTIREYCLCFFVCGLFCYAASISVYVIGGMAVLDELEKIWKEIVMA